MDPFSILGVTANAKASDILRAYELRKAEAGCDATARRDLKRAYVMALKATEEAPEKATEEWGFSPEPPQEPPPEPPELAAMYSTLVRQAERLAE